MKTCVSLLLALTVLAAFDDLRAQGTAFTYQGRLNAGGDLANGNYDFTFALFNSSSTNAGQVGSALTNLNVSVTSGLFIVTLDFGPVFTGNATWLAIGVRTNGGTNFTALNPLQELTPTPYAMFAEGANAAGLSGTIASSNIASGTITSNLLAVGAVGSNQIASGIGLWTQSGQNLFYNNGGVGIGTSVPAAALEVNGTAQIDGVADCAGGIYLSSTNGFHQSSFGEFYVDAPSVVGGRFTVSTNGNVGVGLSAPATALHVSSATDTEISVQSTAPGGRRWTAQSSGNSVPSLAGSFQIIDRTAGAARLVIDTNGNISGNGSGLTGISAASLSSIGNDNGGSGNFFIGPSGNSAMSGIANAGEGYAALYYNTSGSYNVADGYDALYYNTIGNYNTASGFYALPNNTSGSFNTADGSYALGGNMSGSSNVADGYLALGKITNASYNTAVGVSALASLTSGSYNIGLGSGAGMGLTTGNSNIDIGNAGQTGDNNITRIGTSQTACYLAGTVYANGTFVSSSDRNAKENFKPVDSRQVLEKVAALPVSRWNYKRDTTSEHIGPMAQDFYSAFQVGPDDKHITTVDEGGVALAAIQGLNQKLEEKERQINDLKARLGRLESLLNAKGESK